MTKRKVGMTPAAVEKILSRAAAPRSKSFTNIKAFFDWLCAPPRQSPTQDSDKR